MKKARTLYLVLFAVALITSNNLYAQVGYFDAPYTRYEADLGTLTNAATLAKSYNQSVLQSEASDQTCINLSNSGASVSWTVTADGDGLVVRYSVPDGQSGALNVYANGVSVGTLNLTSYYSWEYLSSNGDPNNAGVINSNPKMRFDEVRMKLPSKILAGGNLKLVWQSGTIALDFAELELVPAAVSAAGGDVVYGGNGSDLQNVIDANGGKTIYLPSGTYNVNNQLYFGVNNTVLKGAGMWYTEIHFTNGGGNQGGLTADASNISYSGLYLTTVRNSRTNSYKAINGVYTSGSTITNVWAEHFECGAWIAQFNTAGPSVANGFTMSNCRFRDNYADGTNLSKGTLNATVTHCSYRNNGDDDMAIWSANNQECQNNTFSYNTAENSWRASGCAIYGGYNNQAHHLLIKDNIEAGLRVNNEFGGSPFNTGGMHTFANIRVISCGTYNDLFNNPVGALDIAVNGTAGNRINNVTFSCIELINSRNDAIYMNKLSGGDGFYNLIFQNITVDGTGKEYPTNSNGSGNGGGRGYGLLFWGYPGGYGNYCNMTYANRGGNATSDVNTGQIGSFSWSVAGSCPTGCSLGSSSSTTITSASTFGVCNNPITLTASTTAPTSNTVSYVEFFVDGTSIGQDNSSPYSMLWNSPTAGSHSVIAVAHYSPSNTTSSSATQSVYVANEIYPAGTPPVIDGTIDGSWGGYAAMQLTQGYNSPPDLAATFQTRYDATNLYILVNVTDDVVQNDGGNNWDNDGVEVFVDMGNTKTSSYGTNDFQFAFVTGNTTVYEYQHNATTGVTFAQGARTGGYIMEIKIPWSTLGGAPSAGSFIGFDVGINDDDTGGARDNQLSWNDPTFTEYSNPSLFGTLQIANCISPLPVDWISFSGKNKNETVILNWSTANEVNNKKFVVERSNHLPDWTVIGEVESKGSSTAVTNYDFTDYVQQSGTVYYRLEQVDINGSVSYSEIISVQSFLQTTLIIAPNPFEEELTIAYNVKGTVRVQIIDVMGRTVYNDELENEAGLFSIHPALSPGTYIVLLHSATSITQQKVIKK